jgi:hypothetical protein
MIGTQTRPRPEAVRSKARPVVDDHYVVVWPPAVEPEALARSGLGAVWPGQAEAEIQRHPGARSGVGRFVLLSLTGWLGLVVLWKRLIRGS